MIDQSNFMTQKPSADIWTSAAVREHFQANKLLEEWLNLHEGASFEERRQAMHAAQALQHYGVEGEDANGVPNLRLPLHRRLEVLRVAGRSRALEALAAFDNKTLAESTFEAMLAEKTLVPDRDNRLNLVVLETVSPWAEAAGAPPVIDREEIGRAIARADFLRSMAGPDLHRFVGRSGLLATLANWWASFDAEPLLVEGPGGIGKSFAISRFLADLLDRPSSDRPDAIFHLDFDRVSLQRARISAILTECIRQAAANWALGDGEHLKMLLRQATSGDMDVELLHNTSRGRERTADSELFARRLVDAMMSTSLSVLKFILFVDSFEQVELFSSTARNAPARVGLLLRRAGAEVKMIYASRNFVEPRQLSKLPPVRLRQFSVREARQYLMNEAERSNLDANGAAVTKVVEAVGRSPLSLRMAVSLLERGDELPRASDWAEKAARSPEIVQAVLYDRILRRIQNPDLRRIALPGLLVRRLTADVIDRVLAKACDLSEETSPQELMWLAESEGSQLFTSDAADPGALRHRQDVRTLMLPTIDRVVETSTARDIDNAAVRFYEAQSGLISRTEELYHRLRLAQPFDELEARWSDEAGLRLRAAIKDFPKSSRNFLRFRLRRPATGYEFVEYSSRASTSPEIQTDLRREALSELQEGQLSARLRNRIIAEELDNLSGPLGDVAAQMFLLDRQYDRLIDGARRVLVGRPGDPEVSAGVLSTAAAFLEGRNHLSDATTFWQRAWQMAEELGGSHALAALTGLIRIRRKTAENRRRREFEMQTGLEIMTRMGHRQLRRERVLAREVAAEFCEMLEQNNVSILTSVVEFVIKTNEAFPSVERMPERVPVLYRRFRVTENEEDSVVKLNSILINWLYEGNRVRPWFIESLAKELRFEVDWTLKWAADEPNFFKSL